MNLRETILAGHSKAQTNKIISWVGTSQQRFDKLFNLFMHDDYRVIQRAAWPMSYCVIKHPKLITKHFPELILNLFKADSHNAVKRNTLRLLQHINIPEKYHWEIMALCFQYVSSPTEAAAIKAFALTILHNLSEQYPDIKTELGVIIEDRWKYETPAFHSRAAKFLKDAKRK